MFKMFLCDVFFFNSLSVLVYFVISSVCFYCNLVIVHKLPNLLVRHLSDRGAALSQTSYVEIGFLIGSQQVTEVSFFELTCFSRSYPLFSLIDKTGFLIGYKKPNLLTYTLMLLTLPYASNYSTTMANKIQLGPVVQKVDNLSSG